MLSARDLSFSHDNRLLLDGVSFAIEEGERVALVGHNGAGKSTLFSLLVGDLKPDDGEIHVERNVEVGVLRQEPNIDPDLSALDVVRSGLGPLLAKIAEHEALCASEKAAESGTKIAELGAEIEALGGFDVEHRVHTVLSRLGVAAREEKAGTLSGGERRRIDLARLLVSAPRAILLDEPTNHLDQGAIRFLSETLASWNGAVCFISHDRAFIDGLATRILELDKARVFSHSPPWESFLEARLNREEVEGKAAARRKRQWARELAWLRAGVKARTTKQKARIERADELLDDVKKDVEMRRDRVLKARKSETRLGRTILELRELALGHGERTFFADLELLLTVGERWGIVGKNGAGKTTLLRTILGEVEPKKGEVRLGKNTHVAVLDQHRKDLDDEQTLQDVLADGGGDQVHTPTGNVHVCSYLERFLFAPEDARRKVATLSGGEQNRLRLAALLKGNANCLLLDEPTNDLDVSTLGVLEDLLLDLDGVALIVSHDRAFLDRVCTGILAFEENPAFDGSPEAIANGVAEHVVIVQQGDYTNYERLKAERERAAEGAPVAVVKEAAAPAPERVREGVRKRSYREEEEYAAMEETVLTAESRKEELEAALADGSIFTHEPERGREMSEELASLEAKIEALYARWQELEQLR